MEAIPPKLAAALVQAQIAAEAVEKDRRNKHDGYDYASTEAIIEASRKPLNAAKLAVIPRGMELRETVGNGAERITARVVFGVVHESGEQITGDPYDQIVVPIKGRGIDKATAAARTTALGYFLRDLLQLPRVDAEVDERGDSEKPQQQQRRQEPQKQQQPTEGERLAQEREPGSDDVTGQEMLRAAAEQIVYSYKEVGKSTKPRTAEAWKKAGLPEPKTWAGLSAAQALVLGLKAKEVATSIVMGNTIGKGA